MNEENIKEQVKTLGGDALLFKALALIVYTFYRRSMVVGMGFLQAKPDDEALRIMLKNAESHAEFLQGSEYSIKTDYLFGRMMKTDFYIDIKTGKVRLSYSDNPEYTSWIGLKSSPSEQAKALVSAGILKCIEDGSFSDEVLVKLVNANA